MRFTPPPEPPQFDARCRRPGRKWLRDHPGHDRPHDYWSPFEPQLREGFRGLCGYCVMVVMKAQMDHFLPVSVLKKRRQDHLAYEWSNFRYGEAVLNQRKHDHLILDPFEVRDEWFRVLLPSLQLVLTGEVPRRLRKKAEFTLERLGLRDDEVVIRYRQTWFRMYQEGKLTLEGLGEVAPLIARAVEADMRQGRDWRLPATGGSAARSRPRR
jgi:hypothetical protein